MLVHCPLQTNGPSGSIIGLCRFSRGIDCSRGLRAFAGQPKSLRSKGFSADQQNPTTAKGAVSGGPEMVGALFWPLQTLQAWAPCQPGRPLYAGLLSSKLAYAEKVRSQFLSLRHHAHPHMQVKASSRDVPAR
jgi:hypothetical protein